MKLNYFLVFLLLNVLTSCFPYHQLIYMQDHSQEKGYVNPYTKTTEITEAYKIKPKDYLYIRVMTPKKELNDLYNLSYGIGSSSGYNAYGSSKFISYLVNDDGTIDFPYIGAVAVKGLRLRETKNKLEEVLKQNLNVFTVQVQLTNNQFTILGEVRRPAQYPMDKDQLTIFEALAIAGDLTAYGKRNKIQIIRPCEEGTKTIIVDLTDKNIIDSQQYYILPNDMVYVEPKRAKQYGVGETFPINTILSILSFGILIWQISK